MLLQIKANPITQPIAESYLATTKYLPNSIALHLLL
jgi:hypothetical protein